MATPRDIRRLALRAIVQLDAQGETAADLIRGSLTHLDEEEPDNLAATDRADFRPAEVEKAFALAIGAHRGRRDADEAVKLLAPTWPANRQPAIDRAIVRLAHFEMHQPGSRPKAVVNEAVELAKRYSTERSPAFVNGVLDKILKQVLATAPAAEAGDPEAESSSAPDA
jgi:N utilization substance protein B